VGTHGVVAVKGLRAGWAIAIASALLVALAGAGAPVSGSSTYATDGWGLVVAWAALDADAERFERPPADLAEG
jgi:hypothetical protein